MMTCVSCGARTDDFPTNPKRHRGRCTRCTRSYRRAWVKRNQARQNRYQLKYVQRKKLELGAHLFRYLLEHPCVGCGETDPRVLECDHLPELGDKTANISAMVNALKPWPEILAEIEKCVVRCRNCHIIRTHEVNNSWRHQLWQGLLGNAHEAAQYEPPYEQAWWENIMGAR